MMQYNDNKKEWGLREKIKLIFFFNLEKNINKKNVTFCDVGGGGGGGGG